MRITAHKIWTPELIDINAWYDAADPNTITVVGTNQVSQWDDKSGNNNHLTQGNGTLQPYYTASDSVMGNKPSVYSLGVWKYLGQTNICPTKRVYFIAYYGNGTLSTFSNHCAIMADHNANGVRLTGRAGSPGTTYWDGYRSTAQNFDYYVTPGVVNKNGSTFNMVMAAGSPIYPCLPMPATFWKITSSTLHNLRWRLLGNQASYTYWDDGGIGEYIFTDGTEDLATQQKIEGYMMWKWGLQNNLPSDHPFKYRRPLLGD